MGYYLQIDEDEMASLASNTGWGDVIRWVETLPPKDAPQLHHFCEYGWSQEADGLKSQLAQMTKARPPHDPDTQSTLANFSALLSAHKGPITVVSVTDGIGEADDEDAEDEGDDG